MEYTLVDLLPYKIKDRERFYQRDHLDVEPATFLWERYWSVFEKKSIEGTWVADKGGTWVFMSPKLFFFINYQIIEDEKKNKIKPWLRDIEWLQSIYWLCCEGFSGFEDDNKYTSHHLVRDFNNGSLNELQKGQIPPSCYYKGKLKEYVDPWTFLTKTYLIDDPRGPLGRPLYSPSKSKKSKKNTGITDLLRKMNYLVLGARGTAKTQWFFQGVVFHEYTFSGVKFMEDLQGTANPIYLGLVGGDGKQFQRSINNIKNFYDSQPGKYQMDPENPDDIYWGPFYKNYQGSWPAGKQIQHIVKSGGANNAILHAGATLQTGVLAKDKIDVLAGGRIAVIGVEEVGQLGDLMPKFFDYVYDSMKAIGKKIGILGMIGTSGDLDQFEGIKDFWENPDRYDIFSIPNYWANTNKRIGLFISYVYTNRDYEDDEGNIYLEQALDAAIAEYNDWDLRKDQAGASSAKMNNPIQPKDMTVSSSASKYPKKAASEQLYSIENNDLWETYANPGDFEFDTNQPYGVKFNRADNDERVITTLGVDAKRKDKRGQAVIFEMPREYIPDNTYYLIFDPTKPRDDDGTSSNGALVYKHHNANGGWLQDGIAAVWKGRYPNDLFANYKQIIKMAMFFNAKIWVERNTGGFVSWCRDKGYMHLLQPSYDPVTYEQNPHVKASLHGVGYELNRRNKPFAEERFISWLMWARSRDKRTGIILRRNIDFIYSKMMLNEITAHTIGGNYDLISCGHGLGLLLSSIEGVDPDDYEAEEENHQITMDQFEQSQHIYSQESFSFENF